MDKDKLIALQICKNILTEQYLTKRQRVLKMNKLRGRNFKISPTKNIINKQVKKITTFKNPLIEKIKRMKYKARKGL